MNNKHYTSNFCYFYQNNTGTDVSEEAGILDSFHSHTVCRNPTMHSFPIDDGASHSSRYFHLNARKGLDNPF